jgi:hypothetical protein
MCDPLWNKMGHNTLDVSSSAGMIQDKSKRLNIKVKERPFAEGSIDCNIL